MLTEAELIKFVSDPKTGLISADKLYRKLKGQATRAQIDKVLSNLQTYQVNTVVQTKSYNTIQSSHVGDVIQIDLMDLSSVATANNDFVFLLTFIDVYSRYVLVVPLSSKDQYTVKDALKAILKVFDYEIKNITSDDGSEFNNKTFSDFLKKKDIKHWITPAGTPNKLAIIERFHRTLRQRIMHLYDINRKMNYIDHLPDLIMNYNTTYHRTIKCTPKEALKRKFPHDVKITSPKLEEGDNVRIEILKKVFDKGTVKYSDEIYTIAEVHRYSYSLMNSDGELLDRRYQQYEVKQVNPKTMKKVNYEPDDQEINEIDNYQEPVKKTARFNRKQRSEPAFDNVEKGEVILYRNIKPNAKKRVSKKPNRLE